MGAAVLYQLTMQKEIPVKLYISTYMTGLLLMLFTGSTAQENAVFKPHHQAAVSINHAYVFEGRDDEGRRSTLALPAWGIDYTYQFHSRWAAGIHTDFIIEKFKTERINSSGGDSETIERSYPVAPALMGIYKPGEHWSLLLGFGGEFAGEGNFFLTRAGTEYGYEISGGWEIFGTFSYDIKWNAYDSWTVGLGIAKSFTAR